MVEAAELVRVNRGELLKRMAGVFARRVPWQQAGAYLDGLASDLPRKNGWTLAERGGDATPDRMQRPLNHAVWDHEQAMTVIRGFVAEHLAGPRPGRGGGARRVRAGEGRVPHLRGEPAVGGLRREDHQRGRRRVRHAGQLAWSRTGGRQAVPARRADDPARRARAGVPEHVEFATKPELAVQILAQLDAEGQLPDWLTGDEVYGQNPTLRRWCADHDLGHVRGVPRSFTVALGCGTRMRADQAVGLVTADGKLDPPSFGAYGSAPDVSWRGSGGNDVR